MASVRGLDQPLTDGEIVLREWSLDDAAAMVAPLNDPEIARWTRVPSPYTDEDAHSYLHLMAERRTAGEELAVAILAAGSGELLGSASIRASSYEHARAELGYIVFAPARGRGVATRAVRLLAAAALNGFGFARVEILVATGNEASMRVAEKAGFTREGTLRSYMEAREGRHDMVMFSLLPSDL